ncbi:MAG: dihydrofolate reductase family protein [Candidatus Ranarchaeia archaeon]
MTNFVYIATSLDGFIATKDGGIEWLSEIPNPDQNDYGYAEFLKNIDAIVMGRITFEKVLTFSDWAYTKPVFVLSNSLTKLPEEFTEDVEIVKGDIVELVRVLDQKGYHNLYVDGGKVIQSFLKEDLIDELIITRIPVLLGAGIPLFAEIGQFLRFNHEDTTIFENGLVKSHYRRNK